MSTYSNIKIQKGEHSTVIIEGEISADVLSQKRTLALKKIGERTEIDGFRKGKTPESVLEKQFGSMAILEEAAELALSEIYPQILKEHAIDAIGHPKISIVKLALGNPLAFKIETAVVPPMSLSDYKKSAHKIMSGKIETSASDEEVDATIERFQESRGKKGEVLSDEAVKEFGDYKNLEEFREKLKENIIVEKTRTEREKRRAALMDELVQKADIDLPEILVEAELDRMVGQLEHDIVHAGMKFDEYLKHLKKSIDDIRNDWKEVAGKKARFQLILDEIAKTEHITAPEDQVQKEIAHYKSHYPDADESRLRAYVESFLQNATVMEWLEKQGE